MTYRISYEDFLGAGLYFLYFFDFVCKVHGSDREKTVSEKSVVN